jgi:hypothetical protein
MTQHSEHMEAFFGVELNQKFLDTLNEMEELEHNLKELSRDIGRLSVSMDQEEFRGTVREARASAYEFAQEIRDIRNFLTFYLGSEESSQIVLERDTYMKIYQIFKWDGNDVRDLKRWIQELSQICRKIGLRMEDVVNFSKLTAQPVPQDLLPFPVYAIDRKGYCLAGTGYDTVLYIDEVREQITGA